jgi:hypothetical protein
MTPINLQALHQFRERVYQIFRTGRDAAFEVMDGISVSERARSAVAVSLAPGMQRQFSSVYKGVDRLRFTPERLRALWVEAAETHEQYQVAGYGVYVLDHTPYPRAAAPTVTDRSFVHGADGRVVGHQYSLLGRVMHVQGAWLGVVDCQRIGTDTTPVALGAAQVAALKGHTPQPFLVLADSEYATTALLDAVQPGQCELLVRLRGNRVLLDAPPPRAPGQRGRSRTHGAVFKLNDPATWRSADRRYRTEEPSGSWHDLQVWPGLHVRQRPGVTVSLLRIEHFHADGRPWFRHPLWLAWTGPTDMDWRTFWRVYLRRASVESVNQFGKQELAWTAARWGSTEHEERWTTLVMLAYWQLLLASPAAADHPRPWEKPTAAQRLPTPSRVQRDLPRLLGLIGTPVRAPQPRGKPCGRATGFHPAPRTTYPVVRKRPATA